MNDLTTKLAEALREIAATDPIEAALDPQRAIRVAREALAATPAPAEPVAWGMRDKTTGLILDVICPDEHESFEGDYTVPLFAAPVAQAEPRKPLTESALCREVCEYGPQSEDEETGFRDGFRAAERVHGIGASTNESNK